MTTHHAYEVLNGADAQEASIMLARCCGARRWVDGMLARRPFASDQALLQAADDVWAELDEADFLEAFQHHPQIGADLAALRARFASTAHWSGQEQARALDASEATLRALRDDNDAYLQRFGFIFIVCATGKTADQMLALLHTRLHDERADELRIAAAEQAKITKLRLQKLTKTEPSST